ncbi:lipoprotein transmembrane [Noviherbaspirillum sp. 17J57-3]|uniref:Lipoprotein transmembrane n=2 Tax=Noviherbaspirillum galbum TaxID=2709383 RepID=A0A6B3SMZ8_9BURK|nr:lipoprotein transmembrane [Noviherbaspirillum galbum]
MNIRKAIAIAAMIGGSMWMAPGQAAIDVAGIKLEDAAKINGQDLKLNGAGIRYKAIFKVYVAGLYLPERRSSTADVLAVPGARRVTIVMLRDISNEELGRGFMSGIYQNSDKAEKAKFIGQLQKFGEVFASVPELKKGDALTVDWVPGTGTLIHLNGKRITDPLPDIGFYNALLKIWIGEKPVDTKLKRLMLGERPEDIDRPSGSSNIN